MDYTTLDRAKDLFAAMAKVHPAPATVVMMAARDEILDILTALAEVLGLDNASPLEASVPSLLEKVMDVKW